MAKIIVVADFSAPIYDEAVSRSFEKCGHTVYRFNSSKYVYPTNFQRKIQRGFLNGPNYWLLWYILYKLINKTKPDIIYFRQPLEYPRWMVRIIKKCGGPFLVSYMNDNPFGLYKKKRRWKYFISTIPLFDLHCLYRESNIYDFSKLGAKNIHIFLPYYIDENHNADQISYDFRYDAIFIGHYENDGRMECLEKLKKNNYNIGIWGNFSQYKNSNTLFPNIFKRSYLPPKEYQKTINTSLISLCFFSKINNDVITVRVFEIPMCGGLLVAERNDTIINVLKEGEEAFYFNDYDELISILKYIKTHPNIREKVIRNAQKRILKDKHEVKDRIENILHKIDLLNTQKINTI